MDSDEVLLLITVSMACFISAMITFILMSNNADSEYYYTVEGLKQLIGLLVFVWFIASPAFMIGYGIGQENKKIH